MINKEKCFHERYADQQSDDNIVARTAQILSEQRAANFRRTDRLFGGLMIAQWVAIVLTLAATSTVQNFIDSRLNIWLLIGATTFIFVPVTLIFIAPKSSATRFAVALGQMLMSCLMIHTLGDHVEAHFHVYGSLAFLGLYRDWRVLALGSAVVLLNHILVGVGVLPATFGGHQWDWLEHIGWTAFIDLILFVTVTRGNREMLKTARVIAESEASEEKYRSIVESAEEIIYLTDEKGVFSMINSTFERIVGYSKAEVIGKMRHLDVISPSHRRVMRKGLFAQHQSQTPVKHYEFPIDCRSGQQVWLGQNVHLIAEDGKTVGFQAVARDITARVKAEQALRNSEERYRIVTDSASDAIITVDGDNRIVFVNKTLETIFGYRSSEVVGQKWTILLPEELRSVQEAQMMRYSRILRRKALGKRLEMRGQHKNGHEFLVETSFGEYESSDERMFTVIIRDITERKKLEEQVRRSEEYVNLFKHANDAILIADPQTRTILDVNDRACAIYGYDREEFIGMSFDLLSVNMEKCETMLTNLLQGNLTEAHEVLHRNKNGETLTFMASASVIEFNNQQAILTINRDITERVKAALALGESEARFRTLVENMNEGLLQLDDDGRIQFTNESFCRMTGYTPEELVGAVAAELLFDDTEQKFINEARQRRREGSTENFELKLYKKSGEPFWALVGGVPVPDANGNIVGSIAVHTDITERKIAEAKLLHNARHDSLTGLPNRSVLLEKLSHSIEKAKLHGEKSFAVLFLDFDHFKIINDSLGHMEGDKLLVSIAGRLESSLRSGDVVARLGGDEFTILLDNIKSSKEVLEVVERIQKVLKSPFRLGEREVFISTSIGIAMSQPQYTKPEEILRDADIAMYQAKAGGRSRYKTFNAEMHESAKHRLRMETEMRLAVERKEFEVYYQPIIELERNRIVGFEALLRWTHPQLGMISPAEFIPIAEENGLIIPLGEWVLRESCSQLKRWHDNGETNLTMSVNLSCKQFSKETLAQDVADVIKETGIDASALRLEVTESHLMGNDEAAISIMSALRAHGVKLSIDDFGTGYSSLSYLPRLPIDYLKIDRSFINRMAENTENVEIVRTILLLAKNLGFEVIAEGVETEEQASRLKNLECTYAQGFLYSKPVTVREAEILLALNSKVTLSGQTNVYFEESVVM